MLESSAMPVVTRIQFHEELAELEQQALGGLDLVVSALERTMEALEKSDPELAAIVIEDDDRIDGRYLEVHQGVLSLLARQAPVASDLRLIAAVLDVIKHFERMGDQCVNIAKLIRTQGSDAPVQKEILGRILQMGRQARVQVLQAQRAFAERDVPLAEDLVRQDDEIDRLNRECFQLALEVGDNQDAREWAMHMMLAARALERIGDNAVDIGEQTAFVVTGLFEEFQDASHPDRSNSRDLR
jgi:phosphate transport system protein